MSAAPIVVTGAASGIGAALCAQLAKVRHDVIGLDISDGPHVAHKVDLSDPASIDAVCAQLPDHLGGLANVAGLPGTHPPARILAVNTLAPMRMIENLHARMVEGAAVVNISSVTADRCDWDMAALAPLIAQDWNDALTHLSRHDLDGKATYELSKKALNTGSLRLAARLSGLRLNIVSPGTVETPILTDFRASIGADHIARAAAVTGGHGQPGDIAAVIAFLLSSASRWVNATVVKVDGGLHGLRAGQAIDEAIESSREAVPCS